MNKQPIVTTLAAAALLAGCRVYLPGESPRRTVFVSSNATVQTQTAPAPAPRKPAASPDYSTPSSDRIAPQPVSAPVPMQVQEPTPVVGVVTGVLLPAGSPTPNAAAVQAAASAAALSAPAGTPASAAPAAPPAPALPQTAGPDSYRNYMAGAPDAKPSAAEKRRTVLPAPPAAAQPAPARVSAAAAVQPAAAVQASGGYRIHTVQAGESAGAIANASGMTLSEFAKLNNLSDPNKIRVGQTVKVATGRSGRAAGPAAPAAATPAAPTAAAPAGWVVVKDGDTLSGIASRNGTTVRALMEANGLSDANAIRAGRQLRLPGTAEAQSGQSAVHPISAQPDSSRTVPARPVVTIPQTTVPRTPARVTAAEASATPGSTVTAGDVTVDVDAALSGGGLGAARQRAQDAAQGAAQQTQTAVQTASTQAQAAVQEVATQAQTAAQGAAAALSTGTREYVVKAEDDIYSIAMDFHTSPLKIRSLNGARSLDDLKPGDRILVPAE